MLTKPCERSFARAQDDTEGNIFCIRIEVGLCGVKDPLLRSGGQWLVKSDSKEAKSYSIGKSGASGSKMANFMMDGAKIRSVWRKMKTVIQFFL